jgi:hypothetical protein
MTLESGLNPNVTPNKYSGASGLVQFMPHILKKVVKYDSRNHDNKEFKDLSGEDQLDYIEGHFKRIAGLVGGTVRSATQLYIGNFYPIALTKSDIKNENPSAPIVRKNPTNQMYKQIPIDREKLAYKQNSGLDSDKDGVITFGDIQKKMAGAMNSKIYKEALEKLNEARNSPDEEPIDDDLEEQEDPAVNDFMSVLNKMSGVSLYGNYDDAFEFARILKYAIQDNFGIRSDICASDKEVGLYIEASVSDDFLNVVKEDFEMNTNISVGFINDIKLNLKKVTMA